MESRLKNEALKKYESNYYHWKSTSSSTCYSSLQVSLISLRLRTINSLSYQHYLDIFRVEVTEIDSELSEDNSDIVSEKESSCHQDTTGMYHLLTSNWPQSIQFIYLRLQTFKLRLKVQKICSVSTLLSQETFKCFQKFYSRQAKLSSWSSKVHENITRKRCFNDYNSVLS